MLLEFRAKNYKSFCDEMVFSMVPAQKQKGLDYSILKQKGGAETYKGLCSSVVYGPNASGKTNIISAMDTFKQIVLRGHIRNDKVGSPNQAAYTLELIPYAFSSSVHPLELGIKFIEKKLLIEYSFAVDLGSFINNNHRRAILSENLRINGALIFERSKELGFGALRDMPFLQPYLADVLLKNLESAKGLSKSALNEQELFLMNGFKNIFSPDFISLIIHWLEEHFLIVYRADQVEATREIPVNDPSESTAFFDKGLNGALNGALGLPTSLGFVFSKDKAKLIPYSILKSSKKAVEAESFESYGTIRFITAVYPLVEIALKNGSTLVVDEFDASIHPMVLMNIIKIFHNDEINTKGAQLIFNTHNPIFLNSSLFRRDEIKFVERNEETNCSEVYSLSDFRTSGKYGVRKTDDYMKNYFVNRYGAIKDVDLSDHFLNIIEHDQEEVQ